MMLLYHPSAVREVLAAARFYEDKSEGLGGEFIDQLEQAASRLGSDPSRWPVIEANIRRIMLNRFPFGIYYRVAGDTVRILAVKHHRQHPAHGMARS